MRYRLALRLGCNSTLQTILSFENLNGTVDLDTTNGVVVGLSQRLLLAPGADTRLKLLASAMPDFPATLPSAVSILAPDVLAFRVRKQFVFWGSVKPLNQKARRALPHRASLEGRSPQPAANNETVKCIGNVNGFAIY
jgi:hypothetical protein